MDPFVECSQIPDDNEAEESIKNDYNEYISHLVNTTPHDIHIQIDNEMYVIPVDKDNILRATPFYEEVNIGAPYKTYSKPKYMLYSPDVRKILEKRKGEKTTLVVSSIVAEAFTRLEENDDEEESFLNQYDFDIQVPNTNPDEVVRDEKGAIKAVRSMIHYKL